MNISKSASKSTAEFQAIILAGPGTNLAPLTRNYVRGHGIEDAVPKSLLPIGNKAMLSYPLNWLDAAGITDVLIVCPASHKSFIHHYVHSSTEVPSLRVTIQTVDDDDESMGTADVLREVSGSIRSDLIVLPCDFVPPPDLLLSHVLDSHRLDPDGPILTALLYERGEIAKDGPPLYTVGLDTKAKTILHIPPEDPGEDIEIRMSLLWRSPNVRFTTRYLDSHVYVLKRTILDFLAERTDISSIKEDLIPWLCRTQYRTAAKRKYGTILKPSGNVQALAIEHSTVQPIDHRRHGGRGKGVGTAEPPSPPSPHTSVSLASSMPTSPQGGGSEHGSGELIPLPTEFRCGYIAHHTTTAPAVRANTLKTYSEANRQCLREGSYVPPFTPHQGAVIGVSSTPSQATQEPLIDPKAQISSDSLVGSSTRIGERTSIKKSIIGSHCTIGRNVRINGCVLMDHVVVKDGCKLEGSILSRHTVAEEKCSAKECETATGVVLAAGGDYKGEKIEQFDYDEDDE